MGVLVRSAGAYEFACRSAACRPPTSGGTGGSSPSAATQAKINTYANKKMAASGGVGPDPEVDWSPQPSSSPGIPMRGVVTTPGGRRYDVAWDEYSVGPKAAKEVINQYSKMMDTYPDLDAVPLGIGRNGALDLFTEIYAPTTAMVQQMEEVLTRAVGFVAKDGGSHKALMMGFGEKIGRDDLMKVQPDMWGVRTKYLNTEQARQYIVTHEVGHMVHHAWERRADRSVQMNKIVELDGIAADMSQASRAAARGRVAPTGNIIDLGRYGKSSGVELVAEAFAMQTHGLSTVDRRTLKKITDFMLAGEAPRKVEWTT